MILYRAGTKRNVISQLLQYFPKHDIYLEPFFGAGTVFFSKPKVQYNIVNDIDEDVYNLFRQLVDNRDELVYWLERVLITEKQFNMWANGQQEQTPVLKAVRFLVLSNWCFGGLTKTLKGRPENRKKLILERIDSTFQMLSDVVFWNCDFREFFQKLTFRHERDRTKRTFCYCDPPYLKTDSNYSNNFSEKDFLDLLDCLDDLGCRWAISEQDNPFVLEEVSKRKLQVYFLKTIRRARIKERNEILITNYDVNFLLQL